jgi:hypothetical protein
MLATVIDSKVVESYTSFYDHAAGRNVECELAVEDAKNVDVNAKRAFNGNA